MLELAITSTSNSKKLPSIDEISDIDVVYSDQKEVNEKENTLGTPAGNTLSVEEDKTSGNIQHALQKSFIISTGINDGHIHGFQS